MLFWHKQEEVIVARARSNFLFEAAPNLVQYPDLPRQWSLARLILAIDPEKLATSSVLFPAQTSANLPRAIPYKMIAFLPDYDVLIPRGLRMGFARIDAPDPGVDDAMCRITIGFESIPAGNPLPPNLVAHINFDGRVIDEFQTDDAERQTLGSLDLPEPRFVVLDIEELDDRLLDEGPPPD